MILEILYGYGGFPIKEENHCFPTKIYSRSPKKTRMSGCRPTYTPMKPNAKF